MIIIHLMLRAFGIYFFEIIFKYCWKLASLTQNNYLSKKTQNNFSSKKKKKKKKKLKRIYAKENKRNYWDRYHEKHVSIHNQQVHGTPTKGNAFHSFP